MEVLSQNQSKFSFFRHGPRFWCVLRQMNVFVHFPPLTRSVSFLEKRA